MYFIADFLSDDFPKASSPASSHLFNNVSEGQKYDRIKYLSLIMEMIHIAQLTTDYIVFGHEIPTADRLRLQKCPSSIVLHERRNLVWYYHLLSRT